MSDSSATHRILIGAGGWNHPAWRGAFYPEDLPEDWELTYYGNEFRVVLIPGLYWQQPEHGVAQWLDASDEEFRFLCELPGGLVREALEQDAHPGALRAFQEGIAGLGPRCLGVLVSAPSGLRSADRFERLLMMLCETSKVCVEMGAGVAAELRPLLARFGVAEVWDGASTPAEFGSGELVVTRLQGLPADLRALRAVVEQTWRAAQSPQCAVLIVDGQPPSIELMRQAVIIAELL